MSIDHIGLNYAKVNLNGGAIALGQVCPPFNQILQTLK